jgi:hypothetical protein
MQIAQFNALIGTINDNGLNTALEVRTILQALRDEVFVLNEVKLLNVDSDFVSDNFDGTGLGLNSMLGFAICNGDNNTEDYRRKVPVGYDATAFVSGNDYSILGNTFGEENHVLTIDEMPAHNHEVSGTLAAGVSAGGSGTFSFGDTDTTDAGNDEAHNNMQPSIVALFIQRIA